MMTEGRLSSAAASDGVSLMLIDRRVFLASLAGLGATAADRALAQGGRPARPSSRTMPFMTASRRITVSSTGAPT